MSGSVKFFERFRIDGYITITVDVQSYGYMGGYSWCVTEEYLSQKICELQSLIDNGVEWRFEETDSDDYLEIKRDFSEVFKGKEVYRVNGQVGGSFNAQYLVFEYFAERKSIEGYIENLKNLLN